MSGYGDLPSSQRPGAHARLTDPLEVIADACAHCGSTRRGAPGNLGRTFDMGVAFTLVWECLDCRKPWPRVKPVKAKGGRG